jgi:hypothetical protein
MSRWFWLLVGLSIGFLLGARAGRERYEQILSWGRRTADDFGVSPAVEQVSGTAKDAMSGMRDSLADTTSSTLDSGAQAVSDAIGSVSSH